MAAESVPEELLVQIAEAGLRMTAVGDVLYVGPKESVTRDLALRIAESKEALLAACRRVDRSEVRMAAVYSEVIQSGGKYRLAFEEVGDKVICTLAVAGVGTCELALPADQFDYAEVIAAMERHCAE